MGLFVDPVAVEDPAGLRDHVEAAYDELIEPRHLTPVGFAGDTSVEAIGGGALLDPDLRGWDIGGKANGGYLLSIAVRAMRDAGGRPDPVTVTAHYLAPGSPGPAEVTTEVVKQGRTFTTVTGVLESGGRRLLQVVGTFGDVSAPTARSGSTPSHRRCRRPMSASGSSRRTPSHRRSWAASTCACTPRTPASRQVSPSGEPRVRGWFRLRDEEPVDSIGLVLATDAFPPTAFNARLPVAWTPTVELTAHVRARPAPGWLRCVFTTRFVTGGFLEEDGEIWDGTGRLVAQSRQLALVPRETSDS